MSGGLSKEGPLFVVSVRSQKKWTGLTIRVKNLFQVQIKCYVSDMKVSHLHIKMNIQPNINVKIDKWFLLDFSVEPWYNR